MIDSKKVQFLTTSAWLRGNGTKQSTRIINMSDNVIKFPTTPTTPISEIDKQFLELEKQQKQIEEQRRQIEAKLKEKNTFGGRK